MISGKWIPPGGDITVPLNVRNAVFAVEQGYDPEQDEDEHDALSWHVLLYDGNAPMATGRIFYEGGGYRVGRICVLKSHRGLHLGDLIMRLLLYKAKAHHAPRVTLGAQEDKVGFYARYGFTPCGERYLEEGNPHIPMSLAGDAIDLTGSCGGDCEACTQGDCAIT